MFESTETTTTPLPPTDFDFTSGSSTECNRVCKDSNQQELIN